MALHMRRQETKELPELNQHLIVALSQPRVLGYARRAIWLFFLLLALSSGLLFIPVQEVARARGVVRPAGDVVRIQAQKGGRITEVLVSEGDRVEAGAAVLRYDADQLHLQLGGAQSQIQRLNQTLAQLEAKRLSLTTIGEKSQDVDALEVRAAELEEVAAKREAAREVAAAREEQTRASLEVEFLKKKLATVQTLYKEDVISRAELGETEFRLRQAEINYEAATRRVKELSNRADIAATRLKKEMKTSEAAHENRLKLLEELKLEVIAAQGSLDQVKREEASLQSLLSDSTARAPFAGVIVDMPVRHAGTVVSPGDNLFAMVSEQADLVVEMQIPNSEIGHVRVGQVNRCRFEPFPYMEYGTVDGQITKIASDSESVNGNSFYRAWSSLPRQELRGSNNRVARLKIGMVTEVEIITDRSSMGRQILKALNPN